MPEELPRHDARLSALKDWGRTRLVVLDLDGTLVEKEDPHVFRNLRTLCASLRHSRHQVTVTVATGRAFAGARGLIDELELPLSVPLILYNGGLTYVQKGARTLYRETLEEEVLQLVLDVAASPTSVVLAYYAGFPGDAAIAPEGLSEQVYGWSRGDGYRTEINGLHVMWNESAPLGRAPIAILVEDASEGDLARAASALASSPLLSVTASGARFLEVRPHGSDKGKALEALAEHLGIDQHEVLAVGDADNDVEMLRWAGVSVAIQGASEAAVASSMFVSKYGAARGAVEVLRAVRNARRYFKE